MNERRMAAGPGGFVLSAVVALGVLGAAWLFAAHVPWGWLASGGLLFLLWGAVRSFLPDVRFDEDGISSRKMFWGRRRVAWRDIRSVRLLSNRNGTSLILEAADAKLRIYVSGLDKGDRTELRDVLRQRVPQAPLSF